LSEWSAAVTWAECNRKQPAIPRCSSIRAIATICIFHGWQLGKKGKVNKEEKVEKVG